MTATLPQGYEQHDNQDMAYVCRAGDHTVIREVGLANLFTLEDMLSSGLRRGRGRIFVVPPPEGLPGDFLVLKQVLHGGLYGRLNPAGFRGPARILEELDITVQARERGVPVPEIGFMAWTHERPCRLFMATVRVPASRSLEEWICRDRGDGRRRPALAAAARAVREMHDAGMIHGDLNLRNVMVAETEGPAEGFLIDLYGSRLQPQVDETQRAANLARLLRSVVKDERADRNATLGDRLRFLRDYCGTDGGFRDLVRRIRRRHARLPLHRLAWRLGFR